MKATKVEKTIYLMRHGRTALDVAHRSDGWLDMPLSSDGDLSLIPAQQRLKTTPLEAIYAPDLKRTKQTAELIASGNIGEPEIRIADEGKTWNLGVLAGTRKRYGRPAVQRLIQNPNSSPLGGESFNEFVGRFMPWFKQRLAEKGPLLLVCSGSNLRCIGEEMFNDSDAIDLDEGGLVVLHKSNGEWHAEILLGAKDPGPKSGRAGGRDATMQDGAKHAMDEALEGPMS